MKSFYLALAANLSFSFLTPILSAAPVAPGLAGKHPLSEPQAGQLLMAELRCAACHDRKESPPLLERSAPDLAGVGERVAPEFLRRFIAAPSAAHVGSTMPDVFAAEAPDQRDKIAEAITHFLIAQSPRPFKREPIAEADVAAGHSLFHSVGCIACHSPRDESGKETTHEGVVELGHVPAKYSAGSLAEFLFQPAKVRPSGRMPDMKLTPVEAKAVAAYLIGKAEAAKPFQPQPQLVDLGKTYFQQFNCAACHKLDGIPAPAPAHTLQGADSTRGCLAKTPGKSPRFNLTDSQTKAIQAALAQKAEPDSDKTLVAKTLIAFNCIACHVRDDFGGVSAENNLLFKTSEKDLGDEARIPPPLTIVGAKLQMVALKKVLFDGESVRPYMFTRMPQFGEANLRHLPDLFARLDRVKDVQLSVPKTETDNRKEQAREKEMRSAGQLLLGDKALNCVACHSFNGKSMDKKGIDLMILYQRLKPSWFYQYLLDPGAFRPRTVMPAAWPGGVAALKTVLDGDTKRQIESIWYYLSLGTSAADPSGIHVTETKLFVTDAARTYRGRSSVAGFRGIAVGFPEKLSYAFNAETGTLSAIWRGDFIRVNHSGQGSGNFSPAARHVQLAQDVSLVELENDKAPWPLRPVMTKEAPVNPDPLYPKNRGYQFKGYFMDDASIPTFTYRSGDIEIEDRSTAETSSKNGRLNRILTFDSPKEHAIWFRALTGKIEAESKQRFKIPELRLTIPPAVPALLRPAAGAQKVDELLLKLEIPKGKSNLTLTYELLK